MGQERDTWTFRGVESEAVTGPGPWTHGPGRGAGPFRVDGRVDGAVRVDRAIQFERALGRALWILLGLVLFELS